MSMKLSGLSAAQHANGRDAIGALKSRAQSLRETGLPRAASAAESAGHAISALALSTSKSVAQSLRGHQPSNRAGGALRQAGPLLRVAGHFARRNRLLLAAAGATIALIGYSAWKRRESEAEVPDEVK
ncbi:hypothetical protein [Sphingobium nicotianae]|uniref:Uncharacterized protein n=1 Tax=Sphingobium nicotianae TaxID=2782607 RepID=A0A9X1ISW5_9SPHN|nr:hypothetical protein [Sphingobium nicotianae]MBT2189001.1 hypothetical protein [Sphingobium nicotianae]